MSAPDASCASAMTACDGYLPVPTIRRDRNVRPAMTRGSEIIGSGLRAQGFGVQPPPTNLTISTSSPSLIERVLVMLALDDDDVVLDRDDAGIDVQRGEQRADRDGAGDIERLAVQLYRQSLLHTGARPNSSRTSLSNWSPLVTRCPGSGTSGAGRRPRRRARARNRRAWS